MKRDRCRHLPCIVTICLLSLLALTVLPVAAAPDPYEDDDTYTAARIIVLNEGVGETHNFHDNGDEDWVRFYGVSGEAYNVKTDNLGIDCDTVIELYDTDGVTWLEEMDDYGAGEEEILYWACPADGIYFVKIRSFDPAVYGDDIVYDLQVFQPIGPYQGWIEGFISESGTGLPLSDVILRTNRPITGISLPTGGYEMGHPPGSWTLTATLAGYNPYTNPTLVVEDGETNIVHIALVKQGGTPYAAVQSAEASTHTGTTLANSGLLNTLSLLLVPACGIVVYKFLRRKKAPRGK